MKKYISIYFIFLCSFLAKGGDASTVNTVEPNQQHVDDIPTHVDAIPSNLKVISYEGEIEARLTRYMPHFQADRSIPPSDPTPKTILEAYILLRKYGPPEFQPTKVVENERWIFFLGERPDEREEDLTPVFTINKTNRMMYVFGEHQSLRPNPLVPIVALNDEREKQISAIIPRMRVITSIHVDDKYPDSIEDAYRALRIGVQIPRHPSLVTEYKGAFYFSGGIELDPVMDFSSGYALFRGRPEIYMWESAEIYARDLRRMQSARIVPWNDDIAAYIQTSRPEMRVLREVDATFDAPQTLQEAILFLRKHLGKGNAYLEVTEHDDVYYFSGDALAWRRPPFSFGYAIRKGQRKIYEYDSVEAEAGNGEEQD
ncbi:MAG: hypothetical protein JJU29_18910 [Verrucomicrobia bacterium]|nr:hypothetical protein [Verrucomicrobiota bacterium]MCH8514131.1 hypothetical protein [Kiritimatiellia bacterium]